MEYGVAITAVIYIAAAAAYILYLFLQKEGLQKAGHILLGAGFVFHTAILCYVFAKTGYVPIRNLAGTLSIAAWTVAGVFLVVRYKYRLRALGIYAAPLAALIMIVSSQLPGERMGGGAAGSREFQRAQR